MLSVSASTNAAASDEGIVAASWAVGNIALCSRAGTRPSAAFGVHSPKPAWATKPVCAYCDITTEGGDAGSGRGSASERCLLYVLMNRMMAVASDRRIGASSYVFSSVKDTPGAGLRALSLAAKEGSCGGVHDGWWVAVSSICVSASVSGAYSDGCSS